MKNKIIVICFAVYIVILLLITVIRPWNMAYSFMGGHWNLTLFAEYRDVLQYDISTFIYLFFGNIIWFVPLGCYLVAFKGKPLLTAVLMGFVLSLIIEVLQFVLGTGVSELDDLVLNTCGCVIGGLVCRLRK
ncbi:MAG: VanZ family protein [Lachnospiraceae bacterium]|nr:VanZ family protein [Lachnospiraceae bacterium]